MAALSNGKLEAFLTKAEAYFFEHRLKCGGSSTIKATIDEAVIHLPTALNTWRMPEDQRKSMVQIYEILQNLQKNGMGECQNRELCCHSMKGMYVLFYVILQYTHTCIHTMKT